MKKICLFLLLINSVYAQPPGQWMWIHGPNTPNVAPNWGVQGVPSPTNLPPAGYEPAEWTDLNGNFWLFGGENWAGLWRYEPATNMWTWMKGPNTTNFAGVYGVQTVPAATNLPPSRIRTASTWIDLQGNLWLFGGGNRNDLWRYVIATNEWTWMKGSNTAGAPGVYGTIGVPDPANTPGSRIETSASWVDNAGDLWLFGGCSNSNTQLFNDMWRYNIATNTWTWMHGSSSFNAPAVYGIQGVEAPANTPGGRMSWCRWRDNDGFLWLFGGGNFNGTNHDLWRYNTVTNNWAWMNGTTLTNVPGVYGTSCVTNATNSPGSRLEDRASWTVDGNLWMFGGAQGSILSPTWNDLWMYCIATNQWTWISGNSTNSPVGNWGTINVPSPTNVPSGRGASAAFTNNVDKLYIFGGYANGARINDLWVFTIDNACGSPCSVTPLPLLVNATGNTAICVGSCTNISATASNGTPPYTYSWTPSIGSGPGPHQVCPAVTTTYYVQVTDSVGSTASDSVTVTVNPLPVVLTSSSPSICVGDSTILTATGASTYAWSPCLNLNPCTGSSVSAFPAATTPYTVTGTDVNGCSATASVTVSVNPLPLVVSPPAPAVCSGGSVVLTMSGATSYTWQPQTGLSNPNGPDSTTVTATVTSSTTYTVTGYSAEGCSATITFNITVLPDPIAVITPSGPTVFCEGGSVILTASGGVSFLWSDSSVSASITVNTSGTYLVTVTDTNNCSGSTSEIVTVHPLPVAVISPGGPVLICNDSIILSANTGPGYVYQWYQNNTLLSGEVNSTLTVINTGDYTVHITDANGCTATSSPVQVLEGLGPDVVVTASPGIGCLQNTIYIGFGPQSITLTAVSSTAVSYLWSTGETTQSISVTTSNTYSVTAYDAGGCPSVNTPESQITINVVDIRCGQGKKKILLCHVPEGNPGNPQTICVAPSAIPHHLAHHEYDCLGPCSLYYPRMNTSMGDEIKVSLFPNPFNESFLIHIDNNDGQIIRLNLFDATGRIIISDLEFSESTELGSELPKGVYNIEIIVGEKREVFKLVKL